MKFEAGKSYGDLQGNTYIYVKVDKRTGKRLFKRLCKGNPNNTYEVVREYDGSCREYHYLSVTIEKEAPNGP